MPEAPVAGDQHDFVIKTRLSDERIREALVEDALKDRQDLAQRIMTSLQKAADSYAQLTRVLAL